MAVDADKLVAHWRDGADDALASAELLIANGRYSFGLFLLHLTLEKTLKALVAERKRDVPPKTHDLLLLANRAGLAPPTNIAQVLGEFQAYCLSGRYPDSEPAPVDRCLTQAELARAKEAYEWLRKQFVK